MDSGVRTIEGSRQFVRDLLFLSSIGVLSYILAFYVSSYIAHHTSPEAFGDYQVTMTVLSFLAVLALFGDSSTLLQYGSKYRTLKRNITPLLTWIRNRYIFSVILVSIVLPLYFFLHQHFLDRELAEVVDHHPSNIVLFYIPVAVLSLLLSAYWTAHNKSVFATTVAKIIVPALFLVFLVYLDFSAIEFTVSHLVVSYLVFQVVGCLILFAMFFYKKEYTETGDTPDEVGEWKSTSRINWLISVMYQLSASLGLFFLEWLGSEKEVGVYGALVVITSIFYILSGPAVKNLSPHISSLIDTDNQMLEKKVFLSNKIMFFILVVPFLALMIFSHKVLSHFHIDFASYHFLLWLSATGSFIAANTGLGVAILSFSSKSKELFWAQLARQVILVALLFILIPL
tara:strand:+ start:382 stop:1578 length:1197 start_codon:yes stop_codon:yes gene_type:complete